MFPVGYIRTTCPRDCYDGCGVKVERGDGQTLRVLGEPDHPVSRGALCQKCSIGYNTTWQDQAYRLLRPARRDGPKGAGKFKAITWDEALSEVARRVNTILADHGGRAITNVHYTGTCSELAGLFPLRFFRRIGARNVDGDTVCNRAGHVGLQYMFGTSREGFDPRSIRNANSLTLWGCNPSHSAPRTYSLIKASGIRTLVIDPVRSEVASSATIHVRPLPGSDAALAFGMLNIILRKGRADTAFIEEHVLGFEELRETIQSCTPAWTEAHTGVPAAELEAAVDLYLEGPALLWLGQGLQRQPMGGNVVRSCALLPVVTGNIGKAGAGFCFLNNTYRMAMADAPVSAAGAETPLEPAVSHMDLADHLAHPSVHCLFVWNMNPAVSSPRQSELRKALEREDLFTVVIDCFNTKTARYADILLPASTFLEFDDIVWNYFHLLLGVQAKAAEPMGESLPNQEIFRRLASAMGLKEPALFESDEEILNAMLARLPSPMSMAELKERGWMEIGSEPRVQFQGLVFPTPSGKIEVASDAAEVAGHARTPFPHNDPQGEPGSFRLITPASKWIINTIFSENPSNSKLVNPHSVFVHPVDAEALGVRNGDRLRLWNTVGEVELEVTVSDVTMARVLLSHKNARSCADVEIGINTLNPGVRTDMGESSSVHGTRVFAERCA